MVVFGNSSYPLINFGFMIAIWIGSGLSALLFGWLAYVLEALITLKITLAAQKFPPIHINLWMIILKLMPTPYTNRAFTVEIYSQRYE